MTDHTIADGDEFTLTFFMSTTFGTSTLDYSLIYGDTTQVISTAQVARDQNDAGGNDQRNTFLEVTLTGTADSSMAGQKVGIMYQGVTNFSVVDDVSLSVDTVPEPSSTALLGLGGLALILRRRK